MAKHCCVVEVGENFDQGIQKFLKFKEQFRKSLAASKGEENLAQRYPNFEMPKLWMRDYRSPERYTNPRTSLARYKHKSSVFARAMKTQVHARKPFWKVHPAYLKYIISEISTACGFEPVSSSMPTLPGIVIPLVKWCLFSASEKELESGRRKGN